MTELWSLPKPAQGLNTYNSNNVEEGTWVKLLEKGVLWKMSGPTSDDIVRYWMKRHNEETNDLYSSPNVNQVIK